MFIHSLNASNNVFQENRICENRINKRVTLPCKYHSLHVNFIAIILYYLFGAPNYVQEDYGSNYVQQNHGTCYFCLWQYFIMVFIN